MSLVRLAVVGLGHLGLPIAVFYARKGARVLGADIDVARVAAIEARTVDTAHEDGLTEALAAVRGRLEVTTDTTAAVRESDVVIVVVPVLAPDGEPDFGALDRALDAISVGAHSGLLVVCETTIPIGTTRGRIAPRLARTGLELGREILVAHSPERVLIGKVFRDLDGYPKVVGGVDGPSGDRAERFYATFLAKPVRRVRDADTAEFSKLAETSYRTTNIALANELATIADARGIDVLEVIGAANTQPYSSILAPGIGVGGHCLPVYPSLLQHGGNVAPLIELGRKINATIGRHGVDRLESALGSLPGQRVLLLGIAYRPGVKESSFSPAFVVRDALVERGATVLAHDPLYDGDELRALGFIPTALEPRPRVDALVLVTGHPELISLDPASFPGLRAVLDGRGVLDRAKVEAGGARYVGMGR